MKDETWEETSRRLERELLDLPPEALGGFLRRERAHMLTGPNPFGDYFRQKLRQRGMLQQNVFLGADLSENYGYKIVSGEKRTRRRDVILRLCFAARFGPEEVREALTLYGMAPLHPRLARDAALLSACRNGVWEPEAVNRLLAEHGLPPLVPGYE